MLMLALSLSLSLSPPLCAYIYIHTYRYVYMAPTTSDSKMLKADDVSCFPWCVVIVVKYLCLLREITCVHVWWVP